MQKQPSNEHLKQSAGSDSEPPPRSIGSIARQRISDSSRTPQRGLTVADGTTSQIRPFQQEAEQNSNSNQWRAGFAALMTFLVSATRTQPLSQNDLEVWSRILSRYDLETLQKAVEAFVDTGDAFPTAGKVKQLAKGFRANKLGIPRR